MGASDHGFVALQAAYRSSGGIARCSEISRLWAADRRQGLHLAGGTTVRAAVAANDRPGPAGVDPPCRLEGLIACGQVFSFHWHDGFWVPLFQLDRRLQAARPGLVQVLAELGGVLDGWELAVWFVWPNARLGGHLPIEHFASHWPDVVNAARAEPCVASG